MPLANIDGVGLFYEESGSGEPIIFQHGYTGAHESWDGVIERINDRYRCIAIDARGAGDSSHPEGGYTIEQLAADVVGVADALGIERFHYVGQSMGGTIGFELGLSHADRLLSLTLSAPGPADGVQMSDEARAEMRATWAAKDRATMIRTMTPMVPREAAREKVSAQVDRMLSVSVGHYDGCWEALRGYRKGERLGEIVTPAIVMSGAADGLLSENLRDFARLGNATLHVFSRVGHGVPREVPSAFARVLTDFLDHGVVNVRTLQADLAAEMAASSA